MKSVCCSPPQAATKMKTAFLPRTNLDHMGQFTLVAGLDSYCSSTFPWVAVMAQSFIKAPSASLVVEEAVGARMVASYSTEADRD